jgi:hypothetical protein
MQITADRGAPSHVKWRAFVLPDFRRRLRDFDPRGLPSRCSAPSRRSAALLGCVKHTTDTKE